MVVGTPYLSVFKHFFPAAEVTWRTAGSILRSPWGRVSPGSDLR